MPSQSKPVNDFIAFPWFSYVWHILSWFLLLWLVSSEAILPVSYWYALRENIESNLFHEQWEMRIDRKVLSSKYSDIFSLWWASTYHDIFGQADSRSQVHVLDLFSVQEKFCIILLDMVWRVVIIVHCSLWILGKFVKEEWQWTTFVNTCIVCAYIWYISWWY